MNWVQALAPVVLLIPGLGAQLPPDYENRVRELEESVALHTADLDALDALAGSYAMGGEYGKSAAVVERMMELGGRRAEWELRLARLAAWGGQSRLAAERFRRYLETRPGDRAAALELIRLYRYDGRYGPAEAWCNRLLDQNPDDAEVLALQAEVLHWAGNRRRAARRAAERAVALAPDLPDARLAQVYALQDWGEKGRAADRFAQLRERLGRSGGVPPGATYAGAYHWIEENRQSQSRGSVNPTAWFYDDSDGIRDLRAGIEAAIPLREAFTFALGANHYRSSAPLAGVFVLDRNRAERNDATAAVTWETVAATRVRVAAGSAWRPGGDGASPIYDARITTSPLDRWTFDVFSAREFVSITPRAIDLDMASYKAGAGVRYALNALTTLGGRAERRYWSDDNRSTAAEAAVDRVLVQRRSARANVVLGGRWESFRRDTHMAAGFFTPHGYRGFDAAGVVHKEFGRSVTCELRGGAGAQSLSQGADYQPTWQVAASGSARLGRWLQLYGNFERRNYSMVFRQGWYQGAYVSLEMRRAGGRT